MSEMIEMGENWLDGLNADDFRDKPKTAYEEAWKHFFSGCQIMFREGYSAATIISTLGQVLEAFEYEEGEEEPEAYG